MKKIILLIGIIGILLISGCTSSFEDCKTTCLTINNVTLHCVIASGVNECFPKDFGSVENKCYEQCRPK